MYVNTPVESLYAIAPLPLAEPSVPTLRSVSAIPDPPPAIVILPLPSNEVPFIVLIFVALTKVACASVIPYPDNVVGLLVKLANVCAGTLVRYVLKSGGVYLNSPDVLS